MSSAALPAVTSPVAPDLRRYLDRLRDILGAKGTNKIITVSDLVAAGMVTASSDGSITPTPGAGGGTVAAPGSPAGLTATAAMRSILLEWDNPAYAGHAFTEVWGHSADVIGDAVLLGLAPGVLYTDSVGPGVHRYYWIRFINELGAAGPFNAVAGTDATTLPELTTLLDVLAEEYGTSSAAPFFQLDAPTVIGGVSIPAGTYMKAAFIHDAAIDNAKIAALAVDNAKIADLAADKITAGSLQVGSYVQSTSYTPGSAGWRIDADGTAEFSDVVVRGTVYATDGQFSGEVIAASPSGEMARVYSGNFELYKNVPSVGLVKYNALTRIETGIGTSGIAVTIPGYFKTAPKVIVSPLSLNTYDPGYPAQPQALRCEVTDIVESPTGSYSWQFMPKATLNIADTDVWVPDGDAYGGATGAWTSGSGATTVANTVSIAAQVLAAARSPATAVSGQYQYFRFVVRARVEYHDGVGWTNGAWVGATLSESPLASATLAPAVSGLSPGAYTPRVRVEAYAAQYAAADPGWTDFTVTDGTLWAAPAGTLDFVDTARGAIDVSAASPYPNSLDGGKVVDLFCSATHCIAVGSSQTRTSVDGVAWAPFGWLAPIYTVFRGCTWTGTLYVAVGSRYSNAALTSYVEEVIYTSPDGGTWTKAFGGGSGSQFERVAGDDDTIVVCGQITGSGSARAYVSTDGGSTWSTKVLFSGASPVGAVIWDGAQFVVAGVGVISRSADGNTWTPITTGVPPYAYALAAGGGLLVAAAGSGLYYSADGGATWTGVAMAAQIALVAYDGTRFVAGQLTNSGYGVNITKLYTSADATAWTDSGVSLAGHRTGVAMAAGHLVCSSASAPRWVSFLSPTSYGGSYRYDYTYVGHTYSLGSASVLATGDVSWVAIGE